MRRTWMSLSAVLLVLSATAGIAAAADSPFTGTWKVLLPNKQFEINLWVLKFDKEGKAVEIVAGINPGFARAKVSDLKSSAKDLSFVLSAPRQQAFAFTLQPPTKDDKDSMRGVARVGSNIIGCWLEKTEQTEINPRSAQQVVGAFGDLEAAMKKEAPKDKIKELHEVGKSHAGRPVGLLAYQVLGGELQRIKTDVQEYRKYAKAYAKAVESFGPLMVVGTNMQLANIMRGDPKLIDEAIECAKEAVKTSTDDLPYSTRLGALLALAATQMAAKKPDEAAKVAPLAEKLAQEVISRQKEEGGKLFAAASMAGSLLASPSDAVAEKGLGFARQAVKMLKEDTSAAQKLEVNGLLLEALNRLKKDDEAKTQAAVLEKLESGADKEFEQKNIPFKTEKFARKKGTRVVLVELFTGAQCPPCVSADIAFDAAAKTYDGKDVALLQYHLHIPGPDALTNADSEARQAFYGDEVGGTPAAFVDGKASDPLGGGRPQAEDRFKTLAETIEKNMGTESEATIKLTVKREGSKIDVSADVGGLKEAGGKLKLRFALVEETVRFPGRNGQRLHHLVVRALPGGANGFALDKKESTQKATVDVDALRKSLNTYLDTTATAFGGRQPGFRWPSRPLNLAKLKVVAFVQDDGSKKVLQAAQAEVPAAEEKK